MEYTQMAFAKDRLEQLRAQAGQERLVRQIRGQSPRQARSVWAGLPAWSLSELRTRILRTSDCTAPSAAPCGAA
jgi:hypothetical protein